MGQSKRRNKYILKSIRKKQKIEIDLPVMLQLNKIIVGKYGYMPFLKTLKRRVHKHLLPTYKLSDDSVILTNNCYLTSQFQCVYQWGGGLCANKTAERKSPRQCTSSPDDSYTIYRKRKKKAKRLCVVFIPALVVGHSRETVKQLVPLSVSEIFSIFLLILIVPCILTKWQHVNNE